MTDLRNVIGVSLDLTRRTLESSLEDDGASNARQPSANPSKGEGCPRHSSRVESLPSIVSGPKLKESRIEKLAPAALANQLKVALADGRLAFSESLRLIEEAKQEGVSTEKLGLIIGMSSGASSEAAQAFKRHTDFMAAVEMAFVDKILAPEEKQVLRELAKKVGLSPTEFKQALDSMKPQSPLLELWKIDDWPSKDKYLSPLYENPLLRLPKRKLPPILLLKTSEQAGISLKNK
ncbi:MAG: hypothetical protein QGI45_15310 [Myxococcota bacterium]|jgi:hypothetical protein|nr:hypothetical protein [Myxococcota bacterium]